MIGIKLFRRIRCQFTPVTLILQVLGYAGNHSCTGAEKKDMFIIMNFLEFADLSFTYPAEPGDLDQDGKQIIPKPVFDHFTAQLPGGFVSLVGPNGSGKTTFMMLASGRLPPDSGTVRLLGKEPHKLDEQQKNLLASVLYQNMEFESEETVQELLAYVYMNGALHGSAAPLYTNTGSRDFASELITVFELEAVLLRPLTGLSKGELQRVLLAFSLLYGSPALFMDEPLFALEQPQKERALAYLRDFSAQTGTAVYISLHELDLTRRFAQNVLLFYPDRGMDFGTPAEVLTPEDLERAYGVPAAMLKDGETYTRQNLNDAADVIAGMNARLKK
jgi:iron complex transport system ATP-binding protein